MYSDVLKMRRPYTNRVKAKINKGKEVVSVTGRKCLKLAEGRMTKKQICHVSRLA